MEAASNLRPKKKHRRVMSSPDPSDSALSFLDGFEQDLCPVGSDGDGDSGTKHHIGG